MSLCILGCLAASVASTSTSLGASSTSHLSVTTKNVSRHSQMSLGREIALRGKPLIQKVSKLRIFWISRTLIEESECIVAFGVSPLSRLSHQPHPKGSHLRCLCFHQGNEQRTIRRHSVSACPFSIVYPSLIENIRASILPRPSINCGPRLNIAGNFLNLPRPLFLIC